MAIRTLVRSRAEALDATGSTHVVACEAVAFGVGGNPVAAMRARHETELAHLLLRNGHLFGCVVSPVMVTAEPVREMRNAEAGPSPATADPRGLFMVGELRSTHRVTGAYCVVSHSVQLSEPAWQYDSAAIERMARAANERVLVAKLHAIGGVLDCTIMPARQWLSSIDPLYAQGER